MKFEIDPNELTTDQRTHVAAFITGWPHADEIDRAGEAELRRHIRIFGEGVTGDITEEQRLDAEQKSDLGPIGGADLKNPEVSLTAIFGTPDVTKQMQENIVAHTEVAANLNSLIPLDKEDLPWDSRIHSSSKTTIADGSWKLRRGVDPSEVATVKAQLKELMAVPTFVSVDDYSPDEVTQALGGIPVPPSPVIIGVGSDGTMGTQIPPAPKSHYLIDQQPVTLTDLIGRMSKAIAENRLTQANVTEICVKHGVSEFHLLSNRPDLLPLIDADMNAMGV